MALAININDLLNKQKIESNRIEFKKGWNPSSIYHSVCAFANDFDDLGGGYILVGVDTDEATGVAIRPVEGIPTEKIDGILQDMVYKASSRSFSIAAGNAYHFGIGITGCKLYFVYDVYAFAYCFGHHWGIVRDAWTFYNLFSIKNLIRTVSALFPFNTICI